MLELRHRRRSAGLGDSRGRSTEYKPEFSDIARKACEKGATDTELAELLKVSLSTVRLWMVTHKAFSESVSIGMRVGREALDHRVAMSLRQARGRAS